jgi:tRNA U34 2-thiouridine synthase MnmA/TrmU
LRIDAPANTVIVGTVGRLRRREVSLRDVQVRADTPRIDACFRMRSTPVAGRLEHGPNATGTVYLETDAHQIAPGQVAALYDGERIVAAGIVAG